MADRIRSLAGRLPRGATPTLASQLHQMGEALDDVARLLASTACRGR